MYYCDYFMYYAGSRELSSSICSSHWKEERCSRTFVLIPHFFCADWGVKITGYPCNIKTQQKKTTLGEKTVSSCVTLRGLASYWGHWVQSLDAKTCACTCQKATQEHQGTCSCPCLPVSGAARTGTCFLITAGIQPVPGALLLLPN